MALNRQAKTRQKRFGVALAAGIGVILAAAVPSYLLYGRRAAAGVPAALVTLVVIIVASTSKSIRQGVIRGLVLGLLAAVGSFSGMNTRIQQPIIARESAAQAYLDAQDAENQQEAPPQSAESDTPPPQKLSEEEWQQFRAGQRELLRTCLKLYVPVCLVVSVVFSHVAVKRRRRQKDTWR